MFHTPVALHPLSQKINLNDGIITAGSCFAECMGSRFEDFKFNTFSNPFGTVYNPLSLHKQFTNAINNLPVDKDGVVNHQGLFLHYDYHSKFVGKTADELIRILQQRLNEVHDHLKSAKWLIITWGTALTYHKEGNIVANCHKQPQKIFTKELTNENAIFDDFDKFYQTLKAFNPNLKIILTISPVRHTRDTLPLNMVSKSTLRLAAHNASENLEDVHYFPAYEIMMDELRDYRFYKEDMIHPTSQAEDYIWERFKKAGMDEETLDFITLWTVIKKALAHKAFNPASESHQKFLKNTLEKLKQLQEKIDVENEINEVRRKLSN